MRLDKQDAFSPGSPKLFALWTLFSEFVFLRTHLHVTLLLSPDSLTTIIIKIRIQFVRQNHGWVCFNLHNSSILGAICDKKTRRSDSTFSLDLYFVFTLVSAKNSLLLILVAAKANKIFVALWESSGYSSATLNQKDAIAF